VKNKSNHCSIYTQKPKIYFETRSPFAFPYAVFSRVKKASLIHIKD